MATGHDKIEKNVGLLIVLILVVVSIGGLVQIVPLFFQSSTTEAVEGLEPYTPLRLVGRDVYIREGCYTCHSQMIRPFTWETARYGAVSTPDDSVFDHPFQWGSRRIGPDLARIGGKYNNTWHYRHMLDPREISPGSNMPPYPHLARERLDLSDTQSRMRALRTVGLPYTAEQIARAEESANAQAQLIAQDLASDANVNICEGDSTECDLYADSRLVALIAYLQRIGSPPAAMFDAPSAESQVAANDNDNGAESPEEQN